MRYFTWPQTRISPRSRLQSDLDLRLGTIATYNVLEAMRRSDIRKIVFSSSSVIYGEPSIVPTPENYGPLLPISLYGASKLACEGLISAFCHNFDFQAWIFRFANVCGRHGTHGVIVDFIRKLERNVHRLEILGDGEQSKPYLHVSECVDGILFGWRKAESQLNCFNLGCSGGTRVVHIAEMLLKALNLHDAKIVCTGGARGWIGDVPQVRLDCAKLETLGWKARMTSDEAVRLATVEAGRGTGVQIVILAGGLGTRLRPITERVPKPMVEVAGCPFLEHIVRHLVAQRFNRFLVLVGYLGEQVQGHFGDGVRFNASINYAKEPKPLGTAGAIGNAFTQLEPEFLLLYGDSYLPMDYREVVRTYRQSKLRGSMVVYDNALQDTGVTNNVALNPNGTVARYQKEQAAPDLRYVEAGVLCFNRDVFAGLPVRSNLDGARRLPAVDRCGAVGSVRNAAALLRYWHPQPIRGICGGHIVIMSRTPLRMSFVGGGTDLPSYYMRESGAVISTSIDKYVYITVNRRFDQTLRVSYSQTEIVDCVGSIRHPLFREAMRTTGVDSGIEVTSIADVPSGTGLGSSSSFAVGLLHALHAFDGRFQTRRNPWPSKRATWRLKY